MTDPILQIFIVGAPRSGTTKMAQALRKSLDYPHIGEGHWLTLFRDIADTFDAHAQKYADAYSIDQNWIASYNRPQHLRAIARLFIRDRIENDIVIDKTPGRLNMMGYIRYQKLVPNCKAIVMTRRGIENVASRLRKWPSISFQQHCQSWADDIETSLKVMSQGGKSVRIDQHQIAHEPNRVCEIISGFLKLEDEQSKNLRLRLAGANPEVTQADYRPLNLESSGWGANEIAIFRDICSKSMANAGYSFDQTYWNK
ncbi:MAG: sulfotransferase [Hyphomicrobium sp.]